MIFSAKELTVCNRLWTMAIVVVMIAGCSKPDGPLPRVNGFVSSDSIQPTNLVAYWPFQGSFDETKEGLKATLSDTMPTFILNGIKGKAYKGNGNSYASYPPGTWTTNLSSISVSLWFNQPSVPVKNNLTHYIARQGNQGMLMLYNAAGNWNVLGFANETYRLGSDSLLFDAGFSPVNSSTLLNGGVPQAFCRNVFGHWTHLAMTYDGTSSAYTLYKNGVVVGVNSPWSTAKTPASVTLLNEKGTPLGKLVLNNPIGIIIGSYPQNLNQPANNLTPQPFAGNWQGALDQIRIYKAVLTPKEVEALYQLENAGR